MQNYISSFSLRKINNHFFVPVINLMDRKKVLWFQFDTGAYVSLIGLNSICGDDEKACASLRQLLVEEIGKKKIEKTDMGLRTVTLEPIETYPCRCENISVGGTVPITFFFHICLKNIGFSLLGMDYLDDCVFHHGIGGTIDISAVAKDAGKRFYLKEALDFRRVLNRYFGREGGGLE